MTLRFHVVTIFPDLVDAFAQTSLVGKAALAGLVGIRAIDLRDFSESKHRSTDDAPYGGGAGMVMTGEPILRALDSLPQGTRRILLDPAGVPFDQAAARRLSGLGDVALVCGRYEGFDDRIRRFVDEEISLGDFVLAGGEVAAMAVIEAAVRLVPGVLGNVASPEEESFAKGPLLEYPQYTRPAELRGEPVPEIVVSGDHAKVAAWRCGQAIARTRARRPDLYAKAARSGAAPRPELHVALVHHPVLDRAGGTITTALTNLDMHDLARSARTYGARSVLVVTPVALQRALVERILEHWTAGPEGDRVPERRDALARVVALASLDAAIERAGTNCFVATTSARPHASAIPASHVLARAGDRPLLVVFGTGHGLADEVHARADGVIEPIFGSGGLGGVDGYNHLSVRAAAAIILDRIFGV